MTTFSDIVAVSRHVSDLIARNQWQFSAVPVVCFEFSTMHDFFHTKMDLCRMIAELPHYAVDPKRHHEIKRVTSPDSIELDCMGITFRLTCLQRLHTPAGPMGAAEGSGDPPSFDFAALNRLRKTGKY